MKDFLIEASKNGESIDFETVITRNEEPSWFDIMALCSEHGCSLYTVYELNQANEIARTVELF